MVPEAESVNVQIRYGQKEDLPYVLDLIKELAVFEREPDAVINTVEAMEHDGFGNNPVFGFLVAETQHAIVGISLYYYRYSTWNGKCLYLEDLIVTEKHRGKGIGKKLFLKTVEHGKKNNCRLLNLQVLDWNVKAIEFYKTFNMEIDEHWYNGSIRLDQDGTIK